jgi:dihydrolipoamide dehydrogenase
MSTITEVLLPDLGDFPDVEVIEISVSSGDAVSVDDVLIVIESDKASMDIPSPSAGIVSDVIVKVGNRVSTGALLITLKQDADTADAPTSDDDERTASSHTPSPPPAIDPPVATSSEPTAEANTSSDAVDVVVIGAGPGGYTAAFRAADLGLRTMLIERYPTLGGVCLNVGCIPSKALLHAAEVIEDAAAISEHGISFGAPIIDAKKLGDFKDGVVKKLTQGLSGLAKQRKVDVVQGVAEFVGTHRLQVTHDGDVRVIEFKHAIIAAGSMPVALPGAPDDPRIIDSTGALALDDIPGKLLVIGGGIIGLEMATVYAALGTKVTVVELFDALMPGCDPDLVKPLAKRLEARFQGIYLSTKVANVQAQKRRIKVEFEGEGAPASAMFDKVLVAIGRRPNGGTLGLEHAGVTADDRGFISVDSQQRTNVPHIFAIGDICGQPMLAHKATHEAKVAAEVIAGHKVHFEPLGIPSVAYTDPEVAWVGLTEEQAKKDKTEVDKAVFPWAASGRAIGMDRAEGFTKLLFDKDTGRLIGAGIVGRHAGDLISEAVLALELGADAHDIGLTVHPHPTLSETINFTAEMVTGSITDLFVPRRKGQDK